MIEEFSHIPQLYNHLANAYQNAGQYDKAAEWIEKTYQRFPNYLFGVSNYCLLLLSKGQVEKVTSILGGRYGIHQWITNRRRYHVTEVIAFHGLMARYFAALGEGEIAESYYRMLHDIAPDHPLTREVARFCGASLLKGIFRRFSKPNLLSWLDPQEKC